MQMGSGANFSTWMEELFTVSFKVDQVGILNGGGISLLPLYTINFPCFKMLFLNHLAPPRSLWFNLVWENLIHVKDLVLLQHLSAFIWNQMQIEYGSEGVHIQYGSQQFSILFSWAYSTLFLVLGMMVRTLSGLEGSGMIEVSTQVFYN